MDNLDTREWLLTNGLGSFASGTVCDAHTRTYHGWLIAALDPPEQRTLLLARIDASLELGGKSFELGVNFWKSGMTAPLGHRWLRSFDAEPVPTWTWGQTDWQLSRRLMMPYGRPDPNPESAFCNRVLIQYAYTGTETAVLKLRPLIADRNFHYQQRAYPNLQFVQLIEPSGILLQAKRAEWVGTS